MAVWSFVSCKNANEVASSGTTAMTNSASAAPRPRARLRRSSDRVLI
ncbi:MAG TPA: hypothetical protein PK141_07480 [Polyangiaceae bacterium]|nr:hypothetical protein [Polyangiaceae bacterium]